jgi:hypothetical protein
MSTTIITNQAAVKFSTKDIISGLQQAPDFLQMSKLIDATYKGSFIFSKWEMEHIFLLEEFISSNVYPQTPKWIAVLPVSTEQAIMYGYITDRLTSFEGMTIKFKGSSHTSPETALRKLRKTINDAPSFVDYLRFNPRGLDFTFDMQEDIDIEAKALLERLGFDLTQPCFNHKSKEDEIGFLRFNIAVRSIGDILKVIMVNAISKQSSKVSSPSYISTILNKVTNTQLEKFKA